MSYAAVVYFDGHRYVGTTMRTHAPYDRRGSVPVSHLEEIGTGTRAPRAQARAVPVARIDGVSTAVAIATFPDGEVYRREDARLPAELISAPWVQWRMSS